MSHYNYNNSNNISRTEISDSFNTHESSNIRDAYNNNSGIIGDYPNIGEINNYPPGQYGLVSPSEGAFYAYMISITDSSQHRYVITFASRNIADEWWRAVSTIQRKSGTSRLGDTVKRIAPQFYTHDSSKWDIGRFFSDNSIAGISKQFKGKMFFSLMNDQNVPNPTIIPTQIIVDHTSGGWFLIRSKRNARQYWYYDPKEKIIVASTSHRTHFRITTPDVEEGSIMIGRDNICLCAFSHGFVTTIPVDGKPDATPTLGVTKDKIGSSKYQFEDLEKGRFISDQEKPCAIHYYQGGVVQVGWEITS